MGSPGAQLSSKQALRKERQEASMSDMNALKTYLNDSQRYVVALAQEQGGSTWLTSLPLEEFGFLLH